MDILKYLKMFVTIYFNLSYIIIFFENNKEKYNNKQELISKYIECN